MLGCFAGHIPGTDLGPVISPEAKNRILELIESGVQEGAKLLLDGRGLVVPGFEKGNFVGPTILTDVTVSIETLFSLCMCVYLRSFFFFLLSKNSPACAVTRKRFLVQFWCACLLIPLMKPFKSSTKIPMEMVQQSSPTMVLLQGSSLLKLKLARYVKEIFAFFSVCCSSLLLTCNEFWLV